MAESKPVVLSREDIERVDDLERKEVNMPEWGGTVFIRALTAAERDHIEGMTLKLEKEQRIDELRATVVAFSLCDEKGKRLFTRKDVSILQKKSARAINRLWEVAKEFNAFGEEPMGELGKNSEGGTAAVSPSN